MQWFDPEDHGNDAKGLFFVRTGQAVTGLVHGALGGLALLLLFGVRQRRT
jgi:MYXO-CTERM domain-containing protein